MNVNETRTGNLKFFRNTLQFQLFKNFLSQLAGVGAHGLGGPHSTVGLVISKTRLSARRYQWLMLERNAGGKHGLLDLLVRKSRMFIEIGLEWSLGNRRLYPRGLVGVIRS